VLVRSDNPRWGPPRDVPPTGHLTVPPGQKGQPRPARAPSIWSNWKQTRGEGEATAHMPVTTAPFGRIRKNRNFMKNYIEVMKVENIEEYKSWEGRDLER
jgi:hypothetical protein